MRAFTAMLIAMGTLAAQTAGAYAQSEPAKTKSGLGTNLEAAAHATYSETGVKGRDMQTYDEALAIMIIVLNRTDSGAYGKTKSVRSVVYNPEYRGPINHPSPWAKTEHKVKFYAMAAGLRPYLEAWEKGGNYIPDRLLKYKTAWHSDNVPRGYMWGDFVGQEGETCFYKARKFRTGVKDACTAGRKGAEPKVRLDMQANNAKGAVPAANNQLVASNNTGGGPKSDLGKGF